MEIQRKPKRTAEQLIDIMRDDYGIVFAKMSEQDAKVYLSNINNYLRTASYRNNFEVNQRGARAGKYIDLDFAYLAELSSIDRHLRTIILNMCMDIEHSIKTSFVTAIENNQAEDGYNIVKQFLTAHPEVLTDIENKCDSVFTGDLISSNFSLCTVFYSDVNPQNGCNRTKTKIESIQCPAWVLVELISFGDLLKLICLYNDTYPNAKCLIPNYKILFPIKSLRNACAHNNCILNNMKVGSTHPNTEITKYILSISTIGKEEREKKLSCRPLFEIVCLLKCYCEIVSPKVKSHGIASIKSFASGRMVRHIDYFSNCDVVKTSFDFFRKVLDNLT